MGEEQESKSQTPYSQATNVASEPQVNAFKASIMGNPTVKEFLNNDKVQRVIDNSKYAVSKFNDLDNEDQLALVSGLAAAGAIIINRRHQQNQELRPISEDLNERKQAYKQRQQEYENDPSFQRSDDVGERMARQIMHRGRASAEEILKASFGGEWPPKGLNVVLDNSQPIAVRNIFETAANEKKLSREEFLRDPNTPMGNATVGGDRVIGLNDYSLINKHEKFGYTSVNNTLGHELTHILWTDYYRRGDVYGRSMKDIKDPDFSPIKSYYKDVDTDTSSKPIGFFDEYVQQIDGDKAKSGFKYLTIDTEVQARLHEIVVANYREHGQVPLNKEQLLVSLLDAGLDVPDELISDLKNSDTYSDTSKVFSGMVKPDFQPVKEINYIVSSLPDKEKLKFYNNIMPEMYSDLIEKYGDKEGRARFGLGENIHYKARVNSLVENYNRLFIEHHDAVKRISGGEANIEPMTLEQIREKVTGLVDSGKINKVNSELGGFISRTRSMNSLYSSVPSSEYNKDLYEKFERIYDHGGSDAIDRYTHIQEQNKLVDVVAKDHQDVSGTTQGSKTLEIKGADLSLGELTQLKATMDELDITYEVRDKFNSHLLIVTDEKNILPELKKITSDPVLDAAEGRVPAIISHDTKTATNSSDAHIAMDTSPDTKLKASSSATKVAGLSSGVGAAGLAMGIVGFNNAKAAGDGIGMGVSGTDVTVSSIDVGMDVATAFGKNISTVSRVCATRANLGVMLVDGAWQISREEGLDNKLARGGAVATTTGVAMGTGMAASAVAGTGLAATFITVAAPVASAVAVGMATDAAVGAYKVTEDLEETFKRSEQAAKPREEVELSGAPKLTNYKNLNVFAIREGTMPEGSAEDLSFREKALIVREHEYSKDPDALKDLEGRLQEKVEHFDKIIEDNEGMTGWIHDSMRFFWASDEIDAQRDARIEGAHYKAALAELKDYREELEDYKKEKTPDEKWDEKFKPEMLSELGGVANGSFSKVAASHTEPNIGASATDLTGFSFS